MKEAPAIKYDPVAISAESTVVAEYVATYDTGAADQSEAQLEQGFIAATSAIASQRNLEPVRTRGCGCRLIPSGQVQRPDRFPVARLHLAML
jgi:hypothetical protein